MSAGVKVELRECGEPAEICAVPDLQPDIVTVWIRTLEVSPALERSCYELLSSEERERAARYRVGKPRDNFILTRGTLRSLVATCVGATLRLRLAAWLRQQRTRSGRPLAPSTIGLIQTTVAGFYAFMADRRAEAARELGEPRWAGLTDAHARWWRPGEIAGRYRGPAEGNYIDAAALSRIAGHAEILGLPRDQAKTVVVDGTPRQIRGLGDEQAMRAFLLAIATGRRINEILMMDFAPLSPVPGLDASKAAHDGGPAARLRYQQTKIAGAPQAILIGADVVAIVTEQQEFARAVVRAGDPAAADPPYLFLAWQANTAGQRHYRANTLNGLLTQLAAALQVTDATGAAGGLPAHPPDAPRQGHRPAERGRADPRRAALYGACLTGNDHALCQDPRRDPRG